MPEYIDVIESNKFWEASEDDIFPLPIVAIALGIGRNKMCKVPVNPIMIEKKKYYRKRDILDWSLAEQEKGKDNLLLNLRSENTSVGRIERARSKAYDHYYSNSSGSHYRPSSAKGETKRDKHNRLYKEWREISSQLNDCNDKNELLELVKLAWEYRKEFIKLRMGLHYGLRIDNWWFEKDIDKLQEAWVGARRRSLLITIEYQKEYLDSDNFKTFLENPEWKAHARKQEKDIKLEIEQLETKLKEMG